MFRIKNNTPRRNINKLVSLNWEQYDLLVDYLSFIGLVSLLSALIFAFVFYSYNPDFSVEPPPDDIIVSAVNLDFKSHILATLSMIHNRTVDNSLLLKLLKESLAWYFDSIRKNLKEINSKTINQSLLNDNLVLIVEELQDLNCAVHKCEEFGDPNLPGNGAGLIDFLEEHNISSYIGEFIYDTRLSNSKCLIPHKDVIFGDFQNNKYTTVQQGFRATACDVRGCKIVKAKAYDSDWYKCFSSDEYYITDGVDDALASLTLKAVGYYPREIQILEDYMKANNWYPDVIIPIGQDLRNFNPAHVTVLFHYIDLQTTPPTLNYYDGHLGTVETVLELEGYEVQHHGIDDYANMLFLPISIRRNGVVTSVNCSVGVDGSGLYDSFFMSFNVDRMFTDLYSMFGIHNSVLNTTFKIDRQLLPQSILNTYAYPDVLSEYPLTVFSGMDIYTYTNVTLDYDSVLTVDPAQYPTICKL